MPKKRIFIAIEVPEELKNTAEFYLKPFFNDRNIKNATTFFEIPSFASSENKFSPAGSLGIIRIPKKEGWHVTVVFCGYLDVQEIEALKEIVKNTALEFKPFELVPQKILFAPLNRPRMIWLNFNKFH